MKTLNTQDHEPVESWLKEAAAAPAEPRQRTALLSPVPKDPEGPSEGRYDMGKEFARGGLGRIILARDKKLDRAVAIKELLSDDQRMKERFLREVLLTAKLEHPGIVPIHDLGVRPNGELYYAMKLVDGRSLAAVIAESHALTARLSLLPRVIDACRAIAYAHDKSVLHRDLKPHNIMLGAFGETLVIDWGLAKEAENREQRAGNGPEGTGSRSEDHEATSPYRAEPETGELTSLGAVIGTPAYMPPEQARGESVDKRADVYSLGAILYQLIAGAPPYTGRSAKETINKVLAAPPVPLASLAPQAPRELLAIIEKAMSRDASARYPDAAALVGDLDKLQTGHLVGAHHYSSWQLLSRWVKSHRVVSSLLVAALVAGVFSYLSINREQRETRRALLLAEQSGSAASAARDEANEARGQLREQLDRLLLSKAREALREDPSAALAWLKRLSPNSSQWSAARVIAADAYQRGVSDLFFEDNPIQPNQLTVSPDGALLVTVSATEGLQLWSLSSGEPTLLRVLRREIREVSALAFSHDGKHLAAYPTSYTIDEKSKDTNPPKGLVLWTLPDGQETNLDGPSGMINALRFSPDNNYLAAAALSPQETRPNLAVWELSTRRSLPLPFTENLTALTFSQDSTHLWVGGSSLTAQPDLYETFLLDWDLASGVTKRHTSPEWPQVKSSQVASGVTFLKALPSGQMLAAASTSERYQPGTLVLLRWDASGTATRWGTQAELSCLRNFDKIALSPSGKYLVTFCRSENTVKLFDATSGEALSYEWKLPEQPRLAMGLPAPVFSPSEETLALGYRGAVYLVPLRPSDPSKMFGFGEPRALRGHPGEITFLRFTSDNTLLSTSEDGALRRWDLSASYGDLFADHAAITSLAIREPVLLGPYLSQDGTTIITPEAKTGVLATLDRATLESKLLNKPGAGLSSSAVSKDGALLALGAENGSIELWEIRSQPRLLRTLSGHEGPVGALVFSPDGKTLASGSRDQTIQLWEVSSGKGSELVNVGKRVDVLQISSDGEQLIASCERSILRWNLLTSEPLPALEELDHEDILASPNGSILAVYALPGVHLIDLKTREWRTLPFQVQRPEFRISATLQGEPNATLLLSSSVMAFSPDGAYLAVSGKDRAVHLIDLSTNQDRILSTDKQRTGSLVFSPDGKSLLANSDNFAHRGFLWDVASGERRPLKAMMQSAFSRDGAFVASTDLNGSVVGLYALPVLPTLSSELQAWLTRATNRNVQEP